MKRILFVILAVTGLSILRVKAQAPDFITAFSNSFGGSLNEDFFAGAPYSDGGYLMTGFSNSFNGDIDTLAAFDTTNIFVVKCNAFGVKEWAKTFGGNAYDKARYIMEDLEGNILVVGGTYSTDGDVDSSYGNGDLFVLKLDPAGTIIWFRNYGGTGYEGGRMIQQFPNGDYLIAGYTTSKNYDVDTTRGLHDGWLLKMNIDGDVIWSQTYGGSGEDRMRSFIETPDGGYMFFGSCSSNDFQLSGNHGGSDYWVGKVDSLGNHEWSKLYGGSLDELAYHIQPTSDGNYLLTGSTYSNDGDVTGFKGGTDGWLVKIDSTGNLISQNCYGGSLFDRLNRSYENSQGKIMTFGFAQSSDFDLAGSNVGPSQNFWLVQLDGNMTVDWSFCTGGTNSDLGEDMFFNAADSSFILMGDSKSVNGSVLNNHGDYDFWIVKLSQFTSINEMSEQEFSGYFSADANALVILSHINTKTNLQITDASGKIIYEHKSIQLSVGENHFPLPASVITSGIYYLQLESPKSTSGFRFANIR